MTSSLDEISSRLADLFMTGNACGIGDDAGMTGAPTAARLEVLVLGTLPGWGVGWIVPWASVAAREHGGPAVLLRLEETQVVVQGVGVSTEDLPGESLATALEALAVHRPLWIVVAPGRADPAEILAVRGDRITFLTGADQAAMVSAFQRLKDLARAAGDPSNLPAVGVGIVGSPPERAFETADRLVDAAAASLDLALQVRPTLERIDASIGPVSAMVLPRGTLTFTDITECTRSMHRVPAPHAPVCANGLVTDGPLEDGSLEDGPRKDGPLEVEVPATPFRLSPKPVRRVAVHGMTPVPETTRREGLVDHVEGLRPVALRCPGQDCVEIAVDQDGRLHALADEGNLRGLLIVLQWMRRHATLVASAAAPEPVDARIEPAGHVFTDEPARVADLHGGDLHLHLLAPIRAEARGGWYAAPLNAPDA